METLNTASVSQAERVAVTPAVSGRPQVAANPAPAQNAEQAQSDYKVEISTQARVAADIRSHEQAAQQAKTADTAPVSNTETRSPTAESNYAEFTVAKNNRVVMRVLKQADDNVIKEVPSSEDRHIRDTVARLLDNGGNLLAPETRHFK